MNRRYLRRFGASLVLASLFITSACDYGASPLDNGPPVMTARTPNKGEQLAIDVTADPSTPRVGAPLVLHLGIRNTTDAEVPGVYVQLGGDWSAYTVTDIQPRGRLRRDPSGRNIVSEVRIPAGGSRPLDITMVPGARGFSTFTFSVLALTDEEVTAELGRESRLVDGSQLDVAQPE